MARSIAIAVGVLGFVAIVALPQMADPDLDPARGKGIDLNVYFAPTLAMIQRALQQGVLPFWNPHAMVGTPFVAAQAPGALYPLLVPFALLPFPMGLAVHALLHLALCGLFTAAFLRRLGVGAAGATAAGIAYMGCAPVIDAIHSTAYLSGFAWLPGCLLALECVIERPSLRSAALLAVALALAFLSGHLQAFFYIAHVLAFYALFRLIRSVDRAQRLRVTSLLAFAAVTALGLVSVQLWASFDLAASGVRSLEGLSMRRAGLYPLLLPDLKRGLLGVGVWHSNLPMLSVPLAIAAIARRKHRWDAVFFAALAALVFDFMRGGFGYSFSIHYQLPGGNLFRIPARSAFIYQFAAAALIGLGVQSVLALLSPVRWARLGAATLLPAAIALNGYISYPLHVRYDPIAAPEALSGPASTRTFGERAGHDRIFVERYVSHPVPDKLGTLQGLYTLPDYEPVLPGVYARLFDIDATRAWHGQLEVVDDDPRRELSVQSPELLDLLSVRYYADAMSNAGLPRRARLWRPISSRVVEPGPPRIYERRQALPRAYVVHDAVAVPDEAAALARVRALDFDKYSQVVSIGTLDLEPALPRAREFARIASYGLHRAELEARCDSRCLVVLTDLYDPGWRVAVDGSPASIERVNYLLRGVVLDRGVHRIEFRYRPRALTFGTPITAAALALLIAAVVWESRARRHAQGHRDDG